jgi:hypothetical protein
MSYPLQPQWNPQQTSVVFTPARQSSTAHVVIAWVLAVVSALYLLPWAIAATRNKNNVLAIALINFFLGWSLIGWVVALVMACTSNPQPPSVTVVHQLVAGPYGSAPAPFYDPRPRPVTPPLPYDPPTQQLYGAPMQQHQPPTQQWYGPGEEATLALDRDAFGPVGQPEHTLPLPIHREDPPTHR